jgi:phosphoribosylglycinamide formyltransferase-1
MENAKENTKLRMGVLVSGRGSNLRAILDAAGAGNLDAEVVAVVSDKPGAPALRYAGPDVACAVRPGDFLDAEAFENAVALELEKRGAELVVLAGFMRILGPEFVRRFAGKIINIHPSLLPSFPGLHAQKQALLHGVKIAGCTVHRVDETLDGGPILAQAAVPVLDDDTEETLSARILEEEHKLLPETIQNVFVRRIGRP